jgi:ArsR family transcriptional regulator, arsenate/arsenite/antimonite-responsive transcriptional repressor
MGITKTDIFDEQTVRSSELLKALGHPARLSIVKYLLKEQRCICTLLVEELGLAQATISQHLKALKEADIIKGTIEGTSISYCLNPSTWAEITALFNSLPNSVENDTTTPCC